MKKRYRLSTQLFLVTAFFCQSLLPQDSQKTKTISPSFNEYQFVARGKMSSDRGTRPNHIVEMDNNGEILLACTKSQTSDQLIARGINFVQSQLELLTDWNLLVFNRKDNTYKTTIHIYGPEKAAVIRSQINSTILQLKDNLNTELLSLKNSLEKTHNEKSLFSILYAYIFHEYSMRQLGPEIYQKPQLDSASPFWNGFAWAIYPIRKFNIGVTALPAKEFKTFFVSSPAVNRPEFEQLIAFNKDVSASDKVNDHELRNIFASYGVCNESGELTIPVFREEGAKSLENMAKQVYDHTIELAKSEKMKTILGMETQAQTAMFLHYEIRFAFLNHLIKEGFIVEPIDFENAENNNPTDGRNLVFMIKSIPEI